MPVVIVFLSLRENISDPMFVNRQQTDFFFPFGLSYFCESAEKIMIQNKPKQIAPHA